MSILIENKKKKVVEKNISSLGFFFLFLSTTYDQTSGVNVTQVLGDFRLFREQQEFLVVERRGGRSARFVGLAFARVVAKRVGRPERHALRLVGVRHLLELRFERRLPEFDVIVLLRHFEFQARHVVGVGRDVEIQRGGQFREARHLTGVTGSDRRKVGSRLSFDLLGNRLLRFLALLQFELWHTFDNSVGFVVPNDQVKVTDFDFLRDVLVEHLRSDNVGRARVHDVHVERAAAVGRFRDGLKRDLGVHFEFANVFAVRLTDTFVAVDVFGGAFTVGVALQNNVVDGWGGRRFASNTSR